MLPGQNVADELGFVYSRLVMNRTPNRGTEIAE